MKTNAKSNTMKTTKATLGIMMAIFVTSWAFAAGPDTASQNGVKLDAGEKALDIVEEKWEQPEQLKFINGEDLFRIRTERAYQNLRNSKDEDEAQ